MEFLEEIDYYYTEEELAYQADIIEEWEEIIKRYKEIPAITRIPEKSPTQIKSITSTHMKQILFRPCQTKEELNNWIKVFLNVHLPDTTVDPSSNSNPLKMAWDLYRTAVWYDEVPEKEKLIRSIFYAARGSMKTITATITELLIMLHTNRDVVHCALILSQAKNAYNKYFRPFLDRDYIKDWAKLSSILEKSIIQNNEEKQNELLVIPCTMNATSGPRAQLLVFDEVDKAKGEQLVAYQNAFGMRTATNDKKLPMTFAISTRDSAFGVIQDEIDNADKKGTKVFHWNLIDITEGCSDKRSGTEPVKIYIKKETLLAISEEQYKKLPISEQKLYEMEWGLEGCLKNCKIFASCRAFLKNQISKCKWLKTIEDTQMAILSAPSEDMAIAQLLCRKPPTTGLVFSDFTKSRNVKTAAQMCKIFMGLDDEDEGHIDGNMTVDDFIEILQQYDIPIYMGVDAGYHFPCAVLVAIDKQENIYVLKEYRPHNTDSPDLAQYLQQYWGQYFPDKVFSDPESPDCHSALKKKRFNMSNKVDKAVQPGIATLKGFIRLPGTDKTKFYIDKGCEITIKEFGQKYMYKQNSDGTYSDEPNKKDDHGPDAIRYITCTLFGREKAKLWIESIKAKEATKKDIIKKQLNPTSVFTKAYGAHGNIDNRKDFEEVEEKGKKKKKKPKGTSAYDFTKY